ncbi:MAG TPA: peptidyl-prolyl cis-trans isomerase [Candidatus Omnitrophota bacterium]|nr:peptidyl-prolyl cis-trans isomerase [Candidatus Omnitrophota bacterium]
MLKPFLKKICFFLLFCFCFIGFIPLKSFALEDAIIAVVNKELITLKDLKDYIHATYINMLTQGANEKEIQEAMEELQKNGIHKLIEDKLMLSKANALKLTVNDKAVNQRIEDIKSRYGSEENFTRALIENLATMTELKNKITDQLKIQYVIEEEIRSKIFVNPEEVTNFYLEHQDKFKKPERVNVQSIFLSFEKRSKQEAQKLLIQALERLEKKEAFEDVAKEVSDAPAIGVVEKGSMIPAIEEIIFNLNINEISKPVEVEAGLYLFKATGKKAAQTAELVDVKNEIQELIFRMKFRERFNSWIEKLKKEAFIEIKKQ